jgi:hypothetical protein
MGTHKRILSERAIEPCMYSDWPLTIEQRETIHFHYRNWRPVLTKQQFLLLASAVEDARHKFREIGSPERMDEGPTLGAVKLTPPLHANRLAIEECTDNTIHLHFDDMRLHMDPRTFYRMCLVFQEAFANYCKHNTVMLNITDPDKVEIPKHVYDLYLPWLEELERDPSQEPSGDAFLDKFLEVRKKQRPEDEQRYSDGWLKSPEGGELRRRDLTREQDREYLFYVFASLKKYGYGKGPFQYNYMRVIPKGTDKFLITGSHRAACLIKLGYTEVPVIVTN